MSLSHNTDYVKIGLSRLLFQFQDKPRILALLRPWLEECQALEDAAWDVWTLRLLQSGLAKGDLLDKIGKIVGQPREGFPDDTYLVFITARIRANRSSGRRNDLITIAGLLTPGALIYIKNYPPASVYVWPQAAVLLPPSVIAGEFLKRAVSGGVRLNYVWSTVPPVSTLIFGSVTAGATVPTVAQSDGSVSSPGIGGGLAAGVYTVDGGP